MVEISKGLVTDMIGPNPSFLALSAAGFGHGILDIKNRSRTFFSWHRNQEGSAVGADF
ncbi:hypothetical protein TIFTF001_005438 [Ficus carica]|uniref:Purple acid phosphatase C-terminal domain-containing protein n=1 Tax=Ficus carica TaxID=3494 RepID=A0AA87ZJL2_FICCA|nr:hypothetical protein TIFTF001_005438 [Ficus carica]